MTMMNHRIPVRKSWKIHRLCQSRRYSERSLGKAKGQYGRVADAAKIIDPRKN